MMVRVYNGDLKPGDYVALRAALYSKDASIYQVTHITKSGLIGTSCKRWHAFHDNELLKINGLRELQEFLE